MVVNNMPLSLIEMSPEEVTSHFQELAQPAFRASQVLQWVWKKAATDFSQMTNLPAKLRLELAESMTILTSSIVGESLSSDSVVKLALALPDGEVIETVMIPSSSRRTACVSTQAGCGMGCVFCASGMDGFRRNLTAGEIIEQILTLQNFTGERITNVVFMGMGEPLANIEATIAAIEAIVNPDRLGISARKVTVSTVGLPDGIIKLSKIDHPVTLAISLHAPNDELRRKLVPAANIHAIDDIIDAARVFFSARRREVTLEYILLAGVNDTASCAAELARIAGQLRCNINLIRYNPAELLDFQSPSIASVRDFAGRLKRFGVNVQIRQSRGLDADAACGQLRRRFFGKDGKY